MVHAEFCADLLRKGTTLLVLRHTYLRKVVPGEARGAELGVSGLGCHYCGVLLTEIGLC